MAEIEISKKYRDLAMRIIIECFQSKGPGYCFGPEYLYFHGFPKNVNAERTVSVLCGMGYLTYDKSDTYDVYRIELTEAGKCYFEIIADETARNRKQFLHDLTIAVISALAGAFLSEPLWSLIKDIFQPKAHP